jgi:hypothetical protein
MMCRRAGLNADQARVQTASSASSWSRLTFRRVSAWRQAARARGVAVGPKTYRLSDKPRGRRPSIFEHDWEEMTQCLEERPDQTALELLVEFQARYPGRYTLHQISTLQRRVRVWRQQAVQQLIGAIDYMEPHTTRTPQTPSG